MTQAQTNAASSPAASDPQQTAVIVRKSIPEKELNLMHVAERAALRARPAVLHCLSAMERIYATAEAVHAIRNCITQPLLDRVMSLQNTSLGFRTDKPSGYPAEVVREVMVEAVVAGLNMVGNEVNIIAGRMYVTKEGFSRLLREHPNVRDLVLDIGVPNVVSGGAGAVVPCGAKWRWLREDGTLVPCSTPETKIAVKLGGNAGADAAVGKATRKLMARVYRQITGSEIAEGEIDEPQAGDAKPALPAAATTVQAVIDKAKSREVPVDPPSKTASMTPDEFIDSL